VSLTRFPAASTTQWSPSRSAGNGRGVATVNTGPVRVGTYPFCPPMGKGRAVVA
jgi:hypothetical protein